MLASIRERLWGTCYFYTNKAFLEGSLAVSVMHIFLDPAGPPS